MLYINVNMMNLGKNQIKHQSIINIIEQSSTAEPQLLNAAIYQLFSTFRAYRNPDLRHPCPQLLAVQAGAYSAIEQKDEKPIVQMSIISIIDFRAGLQVGVLRQGHQLQFLD